MELLDAKYGVVDFPAWRLLEEGGIGKSFLCYSGF